MKYIITIFFFFMPIIGFGQVSDSLSEILWNRVNSCYSMFEDMNDDGIPDFEKTDDAKNGYLKISGSWPACGCSCSSTVGAYKNRAGKYIFLQSDRKLCNWVRKVSSNKDLREILPPNFGINSFISGQISETTTNPIFFVDFEIPQIGTETKMTIELVPFGLKPDGEGLLCFDYKQKEGNSNCKSIYRIRDIAEDIQDEKTLDYLLSGDFSKISQTDNNVIQKAIGNDDSRFKSKEEIQQNIAELKNAYNIYSMLESTELVLGWNRQDSQFFIKEKGNKPAKLNFRDFLITNKYWNVLC